MLGVVLIIVLEREGVLGCGDEVQISARLVREEVRSAECESVLRKINRGREPVADGIRYCPLGSL